MKKIKWFILKACSEIGMFLLSAIFGALLAINFFEQVNGLFWYILLLIAMGVGIKVWSEYNIERNK